MRAPGRQEDEVAERRLELPSPPVEDAAADPIEGTAESSAADPEDDRAERFAAAVGLRFKDPALLRLALTHRSVLADWVAAGLLETGLQSNERLEFLGDALLGQIVAEYLYRTEPDATEGTLTARRVALVRAETLVRWAREIALGDVLYLAQGEKVSSGARDRMLAGAFEALVAAIYLDRGLPAARRFVERFLRREAPAIAGPADTNPKGHLQELLQERFRRSPDYRVVAIEGPDHARVFTVEARLQGKLLGIGTGGSKREAEQSAARAALGRLEEAIPSLTPQPPLLSEGEGENAGGDEVADAFEVETTNTTAAAPPSPSDRRGGQAQRGGGVRESSGTSGRRRAGWPSPTTS
jgi:ribonuclease-3